jgi:hypothetical protein
MVNTIYNFILDSVKGLLFNIQMEWLTLLSRVIFEISQANCDLLKFMA